MARLRTVLAALLATTIMAPTGATAGDPENTLYLDLDYGRVVIEMRPDLAPGHVARIKELEDKLNTKPSQEKP